MIPQTVFVLKCVFTECRWRWVFCVRLQHYDSDRLQQFWVSSDEFYYKNGGTWYFWSEWITGVAGLDILFGFKHRGGCHISSARVFKGLKHSWFLAGLCLFKAIHRSLFSCQWVHCSYLPAAFECLFVKRKKMLARLLPSLSHWFNEFNKDLICDEGSVFKFLLSLIVIYMKVNNSIS